MQAKCRKQWSYFNKSTSNLWNNFVSVSWGSWMHLPWLWHFERPGMHMNKSFNAVVNPMSLWGLALAILMKDVRSLKGWEAELVWIPSPVLGTSPTQRRGWNCHRCGHRLAECSTKCSLSPGMLWFWGMGNIWQGPNAWAFFQQREGCKSNSLTLLEIVNPCASALWQLKKADALMSRI